MKTKSITLFIAFLILSGCMNSKPIAGYWIGSMEMNGKIVDLRINFDRDRNVFSSNDLMLRGEPLHNLSYDNGNVRFSIALDAEMIFQGAVDRGAMNGTVTLQGGPPNMRIGFHLAKQSDTLPVASYSIEKLIVDSKDVHLSAEIYKPTTNKPHPSLVLLHGATTNLKRHYAFYADFFANCGFEVLIFDKRGSGESTGKYGIASYADLVDDAIACLETMKHRESVDVNKIGLWGHSQGAMLLPLIVTRTGIPAFLIAKSPEVVSVTEAAAYSDSLRVIRSGRVTQDARIAAESHRTVETMIRNGNDYKEVESFIRQNAQKYIFMSQTGLQGSLNIDKDEFQGYYWKGRTEQFQSSWQGLKLPTLVLFGEDDEYVNAQRNESILKNFKNKNIETKLFPRANHNLKKSFNPLKYPDFDWPRVIDGYLDFVGTWVEHRVTT